MNALVIGNGKMGRLHAMVLRDLGHTVTTVDPHTPADLDMLPADLSGYDIAAVATPPETLPILAWLLDVPYLLIEKPVALNLQDVEALTEDLADRNVCVGFIERYNPQAQRLKAELPAIGQPLFARFLRHNDRPSPDHHLDLRIHDVDLARWLGLDDTLCAVVYDTRANAEHKRREVGITGTHGTVTADLMDHTASPLHAMWQAFLADGDYPTLEDALAAHRTLNAQVAAPTPHGAYAPPR